MLTSALLENIFLSGYEFEAANDKQPSRIYRKEAQVLFGLSDIVSGVIHI